MNRQQTLAKALEAVNGSRDADYGKPENNFQNIADYWTLWLEQRHGVQVNIDPTDVAIMLDLMKTARLAHNPSKADNWIDKAGYAACGAEVSTKQQTPK